MTAERVIETDVLVVGAGMAGFFAALKAKEHGLDVTLTDKAYVGKAGSTHFSEGDILYFRPGRGHKVKEWVDIVSQRCEYINNRDWDITGDRDLDFILALIDTAVEKYSIDQNRIYATGFSYGGCFSNYLACRYPDKFAAIAPVAGGVKPANVCDLKDIPVWAFHNDNDPVFAINEHRQAVLALQSCGGDVEFTVYDSNTHDAWSRTYANPDLYSWFLQNERSAD